MAEAYNVFISWSGERSKAAAEALKRWLPIVLQAARPWMSDSDIEKGSRGLDEVARALEGIKIGIICLTPENLMAPWILYEAGALSKTLDTKTRICTYLLGGLQHRDVKPPLGMFQATMAEKEETRKLLHSINNHLDVAPVPESGLDMLFEKMWPSLEAELAVLPKTGAPPEKRSTEDMVAEVLEYTRAMPDMFRQQLMSIVAAITPVRTTFTIPPGSGKTTFAALAEIAKGGEVPDVLSANVKAGGGSAAAPSTNSNPAFYGEEPPTLIHRAPSRSKRRRR
jgi:hypothetical protein